MATTTHIGLSLLENDQVAFSTWRKSIDGVSSDGKTSNMEKIDHAFGDMKRKMEALEKGLQTLENSITSALEEEY